MCFQKNYKKKTEDRREKRMEGIQYITYALYIIRGLRLSTITSYLSTIICCGGSASGAARVKVEVPPAEL